VSRKPTKRSLDDAIAQSGAGSFKPHELPSQSALRLAAKGRAKLDESHPACGRLAVMVDDLMRFVPAAANAEQRRELVLGALFEVYEHAHADAWASAKAAAENELAGYAESVRRALEKALAARPVLQFGREAP
jgi:hypothetical protein